MKVSSVNVVALAALLLGTACGRSSLLDGEESVGVGDGGCVGASCSTDFAGCQLTGTCPDLAVVDLATRHDFAGCERTGTCPDLSVVDFATPHDFAGCQLTHSCPDLSVVDLATPHDFAGCRFTHSCPDLTVVDLSVPQDFAGCQFTHSCPDLTVVDLSVPQDFAGCQFTGTCPDLSIVDLSTPPDFAGCRFTHSCPDLTVADLSVVDFTIPPDFAGCQFTGTCPDLSIVDFTVPPDLAGCQRFGTCPDFTVVDLARVDLTKTCQQNIEKCDNGFDDNCNGLTDCDDPACAGFPACTVAGLEICNNGRDDNNDGLTDCADPECVNFPGCQMHTCDPKNIDCADPFCNQVPQCQNVVCVPTVHFGTLQQSGSISERFISTVGTTDVVMTTCAPGGGGMVVSDFTVATDNTGVKLSYTQSANADTVYGLYAAGIDQACNANLVSCFIPMGTPLPLSGTNSWLLDAGHYYLIIQANTVDGQGSDDVILSTAAAGMAEVCDDGVDNDGNGLTDCADPVCFSSPDCVGQECIPDINAGTVVVGTPGQTVNFTTIGATNKQTIMCGTPGNDVVVEFSLAQTAGIGLNWDQGNGDHLIGFYKMPPAGSSCTKDELSCISVQPGESPMIDWGAQPPGNYLFIFQPFSPNTTGPITATIYAYQNGTTELCHDNIDNDANGLTDCGDPACFADSGCASQVCMPDVNLGTLNIGDNASTTLDLVGGQSNEIVSCAMGSGKSRIVEFKLAQNAGLGISCDASTHEVLGLFAGAAPRQGCDNMELGCEDPQIGPFGCNFEIPNLQAGTYYVLFEAFSPGDEGIVDLTLSSIDDRILEICDNKIDDDMNGFTDCADSKCALSTTCLSQECTAAKAIIPMPLNGTVEKVSLDTSAGPPGAPPQATPSCETVPGGGTQVIALTMPGKGTLTINFVQAFSNAIFALYVDPYAGSLCDEFAPVQCVASGGTTTGTVVLDDIPAGQYWLVVAADKPGDEGPINLQITGALVP